MSFRGSVDHGTPGAMGANRGLLYGLDDCCIGGDQSVKEGPSVTLLLQSNVDREEPSVSVLDAKIKDKGSCPALGTQLLVYLPTATRLPLTDPAARPRLHRTSRSKHRKRRGDTA